MGLREQYESDVITNPQGCRMMRWLNQFEGDDRAFLVELLQSHQATDNVVRFIQKQALPPLGKAAINDHRHARCTCPADAEGRRGTA